MTAPTLAAKAPFAASRGYVRWLLTLLVLIYTSNFIDRTIVSTLAQAIKKDLSLSDAQLGVLTGLTFALFYTGLGIPLARLAERKNRIVILAVCTALWSAMTAVCGLAQTYWQLLLARTGVGVGEAGFTPCGQSLVADHFPPHQRSSALSIFALGIPLGSMIGAFAGGWIAQHMSWRLAFMIVGAPGLILAALAYFTLKEPPRGHSEPDRPASPTAPPLTAVLKTLWSKPSVLLIMVGAGVASIGGYGITGFTPAYFVRAFGFDYAQAGLVAGLVAGVPSGIALLLGGYLSDWIGTGDKRAYGWVPAAGLILAAPLTVISFLQGNPIAATVGLMIAGCVQQAYLAPTFGLVNNMVEPRMRATAIAIGAFVWGMIGLGFGPLFVGVMSDRLATGLFAGGDFAALCPGGAGLTPETLAACKAASAMGLQHALIWAGAVFYSLAAVIYLAAARTVRRDLDR